MNIGFIGFSNNTNKLKDRLFNTQGISISGVYSSQKEVSTPDSFRSFRSAEDLVAESDILFISEDEEAADISKLAVKKSVHLYFESPLFLPKSEFDTLFHLSRETNCLIKFNQNILQKQIYQQVKDKLNPSILKVNIGTRVLRNQQKVLKQHIFDFISIIRDNIQSGIRKRLFHSIPGKNSTPATCNIHLVFDNGKTADFFYTQLTESEYHTTDSFQETENIHIDLKNNQAFIAELKDKKINSRHLKKVNNQDKLARDLNQFVHYLDDSKNKPVTIREENQFLLSLYHELISEVFINKD
jgi:hypothetical protein